MSANPQPTDPGFAFRRLPGWWEDQPEMPHKQWAMAGAQQLFADAGLTPSDDDVEALAAMLGVLRPKPDGVPRDSWIYCPDPRGTPVLMFSAVMLPRDAERSYEHLLQEFAQMDDDQGQPLQDVELIGPDLLRTDAGLATRVRHRWAESSGRYDASTYLWWFPEQQGAVVGQVMFAGPDPHADAQHWLPAVDQFVQAAVIIDSSPASVPE